MRIIILFLLITSVVHGQKITILDQKKEPVREATIQINEFTLITNNKGLFNIPKQLSSKKIRLIIKHINYNDFTDSILIQTDTNIYLTDKNRILDQVVVTAQISNRNMEDAIHNIRVINREDLDMLSAISLQDVLEQEINIRLSQDNILGSILSIQGLDGQNIKIMIDGIPVIGRLDGNIDISQINLNNIERIEIIEGPLSVNYGTDALAGTINLISKEYTNNTYKVNTYYESVGHYNIDGLINIGSNNNQFSLTGGRNYFDGWSPNEDFQFIPQQTIADTNRFKQWKPKEQLFIKGEYRYNSKKIKTRSFIDGFYEKITNRGMPRTPYFESAFDDYYYTWRKNIGSDISLIISEKSKLTFLLSHNNYKRIKNTYLKDLTTLEEQLTVNASDQDTTLFNNWMSRSSFSFPIIENINTEIGYDINYEEASGKRIEDRKKNQGDYALYTNNEWDIKNLILRAGVRWTYNTEYTAPLIPSFHLKYMINNWHFRTSFSKGFRAPSLKELYFEFVDINHNILGNKNLIAEKSNNYQFSFSWKKKAEDYILKYSTYTFYNDINNLITLAENGDEYTYINIGEYRTVGGRGNLELIKDIIKFNIGMSYIGRFNQLSTDENVKPYNFSKEYQSSLLLNINRLKMKLAMFYKYNGKLSSFSMNDSGNIEDIIIDDYHMLDMTLSKKLYKNKIELSLGCKNMLDVQNINVIGVSSGIHQGSSNSTSIGYGRSIFTSIKYIL